MDVPKLSPIVQLANRHAEKACLSSLLLHWHSVSENAHPVGGTVRKRHVSCEHVSKLPLGDTGTYNLHRK
jgi:hypothetical protein